MVFPGLLEIPLTVALLMLRPRARPGWPVVLALALNLARFGLTAASHIRFRGQLGANGMAPGSLESLMSADHLTQGFSIARAVLYLWMMSLVVGAGDPVGSPAGGAAVDRRAGA